jgi:hypothetical protein
MSLKTLMELLSATAFGKDRFVQLLQYSAQQLIGVSGVEYAGRGHKYQ